MSTKRRLGGSRLVTIGASLALIAVAVGLIGYFSVVRASDTTYEVAVLKVEKLSNITDKMIEREDALRGSDQSTADAITIEARTLQAEYTKTLNEFKQTSPYKHDAEVKKTYNESSTINRYGKEYVDTLLTQATIGKVLTVCGKVYEHTAKNESYNAAIEPCLAAIGTNTSVANKGYDDRYYQAYRKYFKGSLVASTSLSKVIENGDQAALKDASQQYGIIEQLGANAEPELPERITPDPRPDFSALINTLEQRKRQLWR